MIDPNTPLHGVCRNRIVKRLQDTGYKEADRLPETITLNGMYSYYRCKDGDPVAHGIYTIVDEVMSEK